jgi:hypothetical protein
MIKIEVTGNSILELADKLLAIGASLQGTTPTAFPCGATKGEAEGNVPKSAPVVEATESQPTTPEPSSTPAPAALDFDTDVAPHVLALVTRSGKPAAQEILSQFGVEKASLLDPARWPELVTALQDAG